MPKLGSELCFGTPSTQHVEPNEHGDCRHRALSYLLRNALLPEMANFQSAIASPWIERKEYSWVLGMRLVVREGEVEQLKPFGCRENIRKRGEQMSVRLCIKISVGCRDRRKDFIRRSLAFPFHVLNTELLIIAGSRSVLAIQFPKYLTIWSTR
jgi:hypothetical protein